MPREVAAGITLAAMIIPLNIGFAQVAGLPATAGLYAGIIPLVLFAIFTSSRQVVASPDAPITALLAATLVGFAAVDDPMRLQYALAIALLSGLLFFVFWFFRLAFLPLLSRAVCCQLFVARRIGRIYHWPGDRSFHQSGQKGPWRRACRSRRFGSRIDRRADTGRIGHHGLFCGSHRADSVRSTRELVFGRDWCGHFRHRAFDQKVCTQDTWPLGGIDCHDRHRGRVRIG